MSFQERRDFESERFMRLHDFSLIATEIVLCASLVASFAIRRPWHDPEAIPFKSILGSIASMIIVNSISLAWWYGSFGGAALSVVFSVFSYIQLILAMNVFYGLIYAYNSRIGTRKPQSKRRLLLVLQRGVLALLIGISIVIIVLTIIIDTDNSGDSELDTLNQAVNNFGLASDVIFFLASLEIVLQICIIGWRSRCRDSIFKLQNGFIGFVIGSIFNLVFNIMGLVETSIYNSCSSLNAECENFTSRANPIATFVCMLGLYSGIFHCCMQWYKFPRSSKRSSPVEDEMTNILDTAYH